MYKIIKQEEYDELQELKQLTGRDLVREILRVRGEYSKTEDEELDVAYLKKMADLSDNEVLKKEMNKIINESVEAIAILSPRNIETESILIGNINVCDVLLSRLESAKLYLTEQNNS